MEDTVSSVTVDETAGPPVSISRLLEIDGLIDSTTVFEPLRGGRSNRLWKFTRDGRDLVCKLYTNRTTQLFPNDPKAERLALQHVLGQDIGPNPVTVIGGKGGTALVYEFVKGHRWWDDTGAVGDLLARLHAIPPPMGLRTIPMGSSEIVGVGQRMLTDCSGLDAEQLSDLRPEPRDAPGAVQTFLHGDVVPGNLIVSPHGFRLIDWQCAAQGDPVEDIAIFLSPAMHALYGSAPLSEESRDLFLGATGDPDLADRYHTLAPAFHWRMAAYCLWRSTKGEADYLAGFRLEREMLESLR